MGLVTIIIQASSWMVRQKSLSKDMWIPHTFNPKHVYICIINLLVSEQSLFWSLNLQDGYSAYPQDESSQTPGFHLETMERFLYVMFTVAAG